MMTCKELLGSPLVDCCIRAGLPGEKCSVSGFHPVVCCCETRTRLPDCGTDHLASTVLLAMGDFRGPGAIFAKQIDCC